MSVLNTTGAPQFLEEPPDWSKPVVVETMWVTETLAARDGTEQRSRRRERPRTRIEYTLAALNVREFSVRRAKSLLEQSAAVVVPVWTDVFSSAVSFDETEFEVSLGESLAFQKFKPGGYAYITQPGSDAVFREILAVGDESLTFAESEAAQYFTAGATVYPCIVGMASDGVNFSRSKLDDTDEAIVIEEL